eukprot:5018470-Amphidinium_carterae.1
MFGLHRRSVCNLTKSAMEAYSLTEHISVNISCPIPTQRCKWYRNVVQRLIAQCLLDVSDNRLGLQVGQQHAWEATLSAS